MPCCTVAISLLLLLQSCVMTWAALLNTSCNSTQLQGNRSVAATLLPYGYSSASLQCNSVVAVNNRQLWATGNSRTAAHCWHTRKAWYKPNQAACSPVCMLVGELPPRPPSARGASQRTGSWAFSKSRRRRASSGMWMLCWRLACLPKYDSIS